MSMFGKPQAGGFMDEIRCDEPSYLIWKWHPYGSQAGNNTRENAIRWGSSLRVKEGEVAVFVYNRPEGIVQDFIEGPFDQILKTDNLPVIARIIGLAYQGGTPFQAEVYFINLAQVIQVPFAVPYFDLYDSRFPDFGVPTAIRGMITFKIKDYREFIGLHRLIDFNLNMFQKQIRDAVSRYAKDIVINMPDKKNIPVIQIERAITSVNEELEAAVRNRLERDFGVSVTALDVSVIEIDKTSEGYRQLMAVTKDLTTATVTAQAEANIKNIHDMQRINAENIEDVLRIQREESQYSIHKDTQAAHFPEYQLEQQAAVGIAGAQALGNMGAGGGGSISGDGGFNPAAMVAGMAMGGALGQNMAGVMNGMMQGMGTPQQPVTPPPIPTIAYHVAVNGQPTGPFDMNALAQMVAAGTLTKESFVWKQGMAEWAKVQDVAELASLFNPSGQTAPGMPPIPTE